MKENPYEYDDEVSDIILEEISKRFKVEKVIEKLKYAKANTSYVKPNTYNNRRPNYNRPSTVNKDRLPSNSRSIPSRSKPIQGYPKPIAKTISKNVEPPKEVDTKYLKLLLILVMIGLLFEVPYWTKASIFNSLHIHSRLMLVISRWLMEDTWIQFWLFKSIFAWFALVIVRMINISWMAINTRTIKWIYFGKIIIFQSLYLIYRHESSSYIWAILIIGIQLWISIKTYRLLERNTKTIKPIANFEKLKS